MAGSAKVSAQKDMTPLWLISLFVGLSEIVTGIAVTQATGGVQITLVIFVVLFPVFIASLFFAILWFRPYVFYPPDRFGAGGIKEFADVIHRRETMYIKQISAIKAQAEKSVEENIRSIKSTDRENDKSTRKPGRVDLVGASNLNVEEMVSLLSKSIIHATDYVTSNNIKIDIGAITGKSNDIREKPYDNKMKSDELLNDIYFDIAEHVRPFTYGSNWILIDRENKMVLDVGSQWASKHGHESDNRSLAEAGFRPGTHLQAKYGNIRK